MSTILNKYLDPAALDETVVNIRELIDDLEEEMQDLPYARPDGLYPDMTVGAVIGADSTAQWAQRESTGSGAATVRSVQGAAVGWNQLCESISAAGFVRFGADTATVQDHKYLFLADIVKKEAANNASVEIYGKPVGGSTVQLGRVVVRASERGSSIFTMSIDGLIGGAANVDGNYWGYISSTAQSASNGMLFDLTQMFGSGNEPATVEEFERMYPEAYYPYSAPTLKPVQIAGIRSTDAQGGELDSVEWETQTLRAAGSVRDELTAGELVTRVGVVDLGTLTWIRTAVDIPDHYRFYADLPDLKIGNYLQVGMMCSKYEVISSSYKHEGAGIQPHGSVARIFIYDEQLDTLTEAAFKAAMSGVILYYELATPTTTPISPALPMTYRVEQGGTESIVVPEGEISAAPVLTIAEPVNAGDEFARIWAAIQSLGYTRNTAQLSRPVSLTDIGSIDEVQNDTAEIDTTKEVTE